MGCYVVGATSSCGIYGNEGKQKMTWTSSENPGYLEVTIYSNKIKSSFIDAQTSEVAFETEQSY